MVPRTKRTPETVAEIAARTGRPLATVRNTWARRADWPAPVGTRGRWNTYDPADVDAWLATHTARPAAALEPARLYTAQELEAAGIGVTASTIRADLSRSRKPDQPRRWPEPDDTSGGVNRWTGRTVTAALAARRSYRRRAQ
ncbi:hypothetical protein [Streptomyces sp. DH37]|uniref:hypothetical protein n=1 Tax=Streptomyces sp. DH37 TaxID=3040122 RepID=UPI0024416767|nr:hypothetical protein [Streptomyces sp. DH37]MDG9703786.1 hypothetical protein [Streptomyces sp. DH37]